MEICKLNENNNNNVKEYTNEPKLYKNISGNGIPTINTLNDLINELRVIFDSDTVNVEYVDYLMKSYKSNPIEWKKFAKFDRYRYVFEVFLYSSLFQKN